jgi:hypothetical protein
MSTWIVLFSTSFVGNRPNRSTASAIVCIRMDRYIYVFKHSHRSATKYNRRTNASDPIFRGSTGMSTGNSRNKPSKSFTSLIRKPHSRLTHKDVLILPDVRHSVNDKRGITMQVPYPHTPRRRKKRRLANPVILKRRFPFRMTEAHHLSVSHVTLRQLHPSFDLQ